MTRRSSAEANPAEPGSQGVAGKSNPGLGGCFPPFSLLPPVSLPQYPSTPLLNFFTIPCNLSRRFPLYGVEAVSLPVKAARRKAASVDNDLKLSMRPGRKKH